MELENVYMVVICYELTVNYQLTHWIHWTVIVIIRLIGAWIWFALVNRLVYCEMCECTYRFIQWKNRVRTVTFWSSFCWVRVLAHFYFRVLVPFGSVLGKVWVLVRFVFVGFGFFPISIYNLSCRPDCDCRWYRDAQTGERISTATGWSTRKDSAAC